MLGRPSQSRSTARTIASARCSGSWRSTPSRTCGRVQRSARRPGSRPTVGSSSTSSVGCETSAQDRDTRLSSPPDRSAVFCRACCPHEGCVAAAGRPHQTGDLARGDGEVKPSQDGDPAPGYKQPGESRPGPMFAGVNNFGVEKPLSTWPLSHKFDLAALEWRVWTHQSAPVTRRQRPWSRARKQ